MKVKNIIEEDFCNYKKPSMLIATSKCNFKCDKECGVQVCQNSPLAASPNIEIDSRAIIYRYLKNPITEAVIFSGLEPFDTFGDICEVISLFWITYNCFFDIKEMPDIIIYTGYYPEEIRHELETLKIYKDTNIIIKFGRFIPN